MARLRVIARVWGAQKERYLPGLWSLVLGEGQICTCACIINCPAVAWRVHVVRIPS